MVDTIERADGSRGTRDVVGHPGAVAILAIDDEDRVLLVRQYRVAIVGSEHRVRPGDIVNLILPLDKLHLFDGETGLTLAPDAVAVA